MRKLFNMLCLSAILLFLTALPVLAEDEESSAPKASLGAGFTSGYYNLVTNDAEELSWEGGYGLGGGFVFEYMWTGVFGVHSGLWYIISYIDMKMGSDFPITVKTRSEQIVFPLYLITSYRQGRFGIGLLTGFNFMLVRKCEFVSFPLNEDGRMDVTEYIRYYQYGVAGGFEMKFGVTRFVDFFIGGLAEYYLQGFLKDVDQSSDCLYDFRLMAGVLFRTY